MGYVKYCLYTMFAFKVLGLCAVASTQSELSWNKINEAVLEMNRLENSDEPLSDRIGLVERLTERVNTLSSLEGVTEKQSRFLSLLKFSIQILHQFLTSPTETVDSAEQSANKIRGINVIIEIANNDIVNPLFKGKLLTLVEYLLGAELDVIEQEPQRLKELVRDLKEYRNSPERTEVEKEEFDLYMQVMGPRGYGIHSYLHHTESTPPPA